MINRYDKRKRRAGADESDTYESSSEIDGGSEFEDGTPSLSDQDSDNSSDFDVTGKNDTFESELMRDESGEIILHLRTQRQMRETFPKLTRKEQEKFNQDAMVFRQLLSLSPDRLYIIEELKDSEIHDVRCDSSTELGLAR